MGMCLIPNPLWGRGVFLFCDVIVLAVGLLLVKTVDDAVDAES
ncbi:hypothetical protein MUS1_05760 [Marinomonas ushuaiensis DSM 15871]|uniref:Uncharacterized protein n=1 Tax=Marinomonas ushuaiensis DSM 15871 TaxID=1122207 RepID=X7E3V4_9GAMM|nr:hypothetical protein MUS1_05760 [Marinomonas ushuaiensis DSM 15871]